MDIIYKKLSDLTEYENNAKKHNAEQIDSVAQSIRNFGFVQPVVIDKNDVIVIGHCRTLAAKKIGMKEVPCLYVDNLTEEQVNALRLADNKTNESPWDIELMKAELDSLFGVIDMSQFGFAVQIENIDLDIEGEEEIAHELGEANNYIVLEFNTDDEWEQAQTVFGLKKVVTGEKSKGVRRHGIGRVINGAEVMERMKND